MADCGWRRWPPNAELQRSNTARVRTLIMRVLVLTNHFAEFAGSEIVASEVAQWCLEQGDQVVIAANLVQSPMSDLAPSIEIVHNISALDLSSFDLVWCQHGLLSLLPIAALAKAAPAFPLVALASLSPYEPYEHVDGLLANAFSARVFANSPETADEIVRRNRKLIRRDHVQVFHNAAPAAFWTPPVPRPRSLETLTIVTNHAPPELMAASRRLEELGVVVRRIGLNHDYRRLEVGDIDDSDALITIGKTVIYGIARRRPVYMYDHFGGDGWLTRANFEPSLAHNFSGRPAERRLPAEVIVAEIISGFDHAANEIERLGEAHDMSRFRLETHLAPLREQATRTNPRRASRLRRALASPKFRAHLELARQNSLVMRRSYLATVGEA